MSICVRHTVPHFEFEFDVNARGERILSFPFMSMSDIHLGADDSKAERVCRWLDRHTADEMHLVGDIIDGELLLLREQWDIDEWHRQVMARLLRKAEGTKTTYTPGNHDAKAMRLDGKKFCGIEVKEKTTYTDPCGRTFGIEHGHHFDDHGFTTKDRKRFWYMVGDTFNFGFRQCDKVLHTIAPCLKENFSTAVGMKKVFKPLIDYVRGTQPIIRNYVNKSGHDGLIYGHSHEAGFDMTHHGKLIINDGCSTDHVQALVHDKNGVWAILTIYGEGIDIQLEPQGLLNRKPHSYFKTWEELGMAREFATSPARYEDEFTHLADRALRIICRAYPPLDRQQLRATIDQNQALTERFARAGDEAGNLYIQTRQALDAQRAQYLRLPVPDPRRRGVREVALTPESV